MRGSFGLFKSNPHIPVTMAALRASSARDAGNCDKRQLTIGIVAAPLFTRHEPPPDLAAVLDAGAATR